MDLARWHRLMAQWRAAESDDVYDKLASAYSEPHRHYHTAQHVDDCLTQFDDASSIASLPEEVELALWFHDAVYKPTSSRNELRSAEWAASFVDSIGATSERAERIHGYILATKHGAEQLEGDAALVVDIDLSILGREPGVFEIYEQAVSQEYKWVPGPVYRRKRIEILQSFLERPAIFLTSHFHRLYENQARENLEWAIQRLRA